MKRLSKEDFDCHDHNVEGDERDFDDGLHCADEMQGLRRGGRGIPILLAEPPMTR